jgi:plastocyanin
LKIAKGSETAFTDCSVNAPATGSSGDAAGSVGESEQAAADASTTNAYVITVARRNANDRLASDMQMRSIRLLQFLAIALAVVACGGDKTTAPPSEEFADVYTPGSVFSPFTTTIGVGGTVRFHMQRAPDGDGHNAIFDAGTPGAPADVPVVVDTTVSRRFNTRGTFGYFCTVHPGMVGEIIVE